MQTVEIRHERIDHQDVPTLLTKPRAREIASKLEELDEDGWHFKAERASDVDLEMFVIKVYNSEGNYLGTL